MPAEAPVAGWSTEPGKANTPVSSGEGGAASAEVAASRWCASRTAATAARPREACVDMSGSILVETPGVRQEYRHQVPAGERPQAAGTRGALVGKVRAL